MSIFAGIFERLSVAEGILHERQYDKYDIGHGTERGRQCIVEDDMRNNPSVEANHTHRHTPIEVVAETIAQVMKEGKVKRWGLCEITPLNH